MHTLPVEIVHEIVLYIRPQENLNALLCSCKWMNDLIMTFAENNQWSFSCPGLFSETTLLTPFQTICLEELKTETRTLVPDMDNAKVLCRALYSNFLLEGKSVTVVGTPDYQEKKDADVKILFTRRVSEKRPGIYDIILSEKPLPVDEYTPLWCVVFEYDNVDVQSLALDLTKAVLITDDGIHGFGELGDVPLLIVNKFLTYNKLKDYDVVLCSSEFTWRVSSLLMQFSGREKKFITHKNACCNGNRFPFPAKKRYEYTSTFTGQYMHVDDLTFSPYEITLAEFCVLYLGRDISQGQETLRWVHERVKETKSLYCMGTCLTHRRGGSQGQKWTYIDPFLEWDSVVVKNTSPQDPCLAVLKNKLEYSLIQTRGKAGGDSFTLDELKALCKEHGHSQQGTRKQLIERLLKNR
jgi:hypothetical protein